MVSLMLWPLCSQRKQPPVPNHIGGRIRPRASMTLWQRETCFIYYESRTQLDTLANVTLPDQLLRAEYNNIPALS
jgi:hypothetical protein